MNGIHRISPGRIKDVYKRQDRHHLIEMVANQAIKEGFVGVLNVAQVNMLVDLSFKSLVLDPCAFSFGSCWGLRGHSKGSQRRDRYRG